MSSGARFVRADLHVHTRPDSGAPTHTPAQYVGAALAAGIAVMGITDHNAVDAVEPMLKAAHGTALLVLPGIEISTHEGHLLALFAPEAVQTLVELAGPTTLRLQPDPRDGSLRSTRSMLDLVAEIDERGGLAIPAHVDAKDGIHEAMAPTALASLLAHPGLAGLEFARHEALSQWFTDTDPEPPRRVAWRARESVPELAAVDLARLMSSDAHSPDKVGGDRPSRTLTRLRLDEPTFEAVRNALRFNPAARCKAEVELPASYPRVLSASFRGGFLDGVTMDLSTNLSCLIGGRGSGKSTALLAIRAALGTDVTDDDDPDDPERMPDSTTVRFVDRAGSERTAIRHRGDAPHDELSGSPVHLELADMGQGASGRLAREQERDPGALRRFLDVFVELDGHQRLEDGLLERLEANSEEINLAAQGSGQLEKSAATVQELEATMQAARNSKVEELAQYAAQLEAESALLKILDELAAELLAVDSDAPPADLARLAIQTGTDLGRRPAADHVHGTDGVGALLDSLTQRRSLLRDQLRGELTLAGAPLQAKLEAWKVQHAHWRERLDVLRAELEQQGLKVQAGEILKVSRQLNVAREQVRQLTARLRELHAAQRQRAQLLQNLRANRDAEHQRRKATLRHVVSQVNRQAERLRIHLIVQANADDEPWCRWLRDNLSFRSPRVERVAQVVGPAEMAQALLSGGDALAQLTFEQAPLLDGSQLDVAARSLRTYRKIHALETMRLEDRVRIEVQEPGTRQPRPFDHLSAGEQRSVLLSLMLSANRDEPLIVDQPEDHLDASYIARSIVRQLEAAKEHRQVIIATHSANLTVLGDAELVIPMYAEAGRGHPKDAGAVDRPSTRERVCELLEGGRDAYRRRGERYGFRISSVVR